ncbi:Ankyrin repeat-containing domain [Trinorchestia longiramus]|nr:Ankyrin repeat-containing domain [Trinorchestia longiramus]
MRNELGDTALHLAAIAGNNEIAFMLASHGCDVDACNNYNITPLHMALSYGKLDVIQTLVRMDADTLCADRIGDTPRDLARQLGYPPSALDAASAELSPVKEVPSPLHLVHAVENNSLSEVRQALSSKAPPDTLIPLTLHWPGHSTVLHRAAHLGLTDIVGELLNAGANVNARDLVGNTPLHTAVQDGHDSVVSCLAEAGADVNAITQSGVTPLHRAAAKGHLTTSLLLLKFGADPSVKDHQNRTPLEWARQKGYVMLARNLQSHMI